MYKMEDGSPLRTEERKILQDKLLRTGRHLVNDINVFIIRSGWTCQTNLSQFCVVTSQYKMEDGSPFNMKERDITQQNYVKRLSLMI